MGSARKLNIIDVAYHRNGVGGEGFNVVRFTYAPDGKPENFIAVLFDTKGQCAVVGLDRLPTMGVEFAGGNSWRGDHFEYELRKAIDSADTGRIGPFCVTPAMFAKGAK